MNIAKILAVADAIENQQIAGLGFNMSGWFCFSSDDVKVDDLSGANCGTVACIAGWTMILDNAELMQPGKSWKVNNDAFEYGWAALGLTIKEAYDLFMPEGFGKDIFTSEMAVRVLRNFAITGKVDWAGAMTDNNPKLPPVPDHDNVVIDVSSATEPELKF